MRWLVKNRACITRWRHKTSTKWWCEQRIYVFIIRVYKLFYFFSSGCFLKEIGSMHTVFLSSHGNWLMKVWENSKHSPAAGVRISRCKHGKCFQFLNNQLVCLHPVFFSSKGYLEARAWTSVRVGKKASLWLFDRMRRGWNNLLVHFLPPSAMQKLKVQSLNLRSKTKENGLLF